jgi:hypothetical protein
VKNSARNPTRRNRNIGTTAAGHGQDNRLSIARPGHTDRTWWEALKTNSSTQREVAGRVVTFIVEKTKANFAYACTIGDICRLLPSVALSDWEGITTFVFRQPTSKQALLNPSWGRVDYYAELFEPGKAPLPARPVIFLDAVEVGTPMEWSKHVSPFEQKELQRLSAEGHVIQHSSKSILIRSTHGAVRNTQLYRTLLHEIGHWVDRNNCMKTAGSQSAEDYSVYLDRYWARPEIEREAAAHSYAEQVGNRLRSEHKIPFERVFNPALSPDADILPECFRTKA